MGVFMFGNSVCLCGACCMKCVRRFVYNCSHRNTHL